ncbi:heavy-metal-associated domain-containing protein [Ectothiorhodospira lacustris]|uniref:heavy-metal-associated domain-containing protein n=1 Tax=Ectothiorhodospira lacustris TaxID=2899127 RepID=UPI001EE84CBC|nr:heavy-metal-associated domain-containing protein [Ectothiorhodospira lacustris]MCG5501814.1 heavy-metal-associated domain-containing protein [Ectothiorhodospira lacustris]MCG5511483.1 heavy-metal-associated domain-containing protein [Ectothiorhodospira lacustris]MCG5523267.1 heavy-metal-associated domain-containing protein [Ectothiorhodospira lacustris]
MTHADLLLQLLSRVRVAHHLRGRIRLKLDTDLKGLAGAADIPEIERMLDQLPGVFSVRLNLLARSCLVEYDPDVIPMAAWEDFLQGRATEAADTLRRIVQQARHELMDAVPG